MLADCCLPNVSSNDLNNWPRRFMMTLFACIWSHIWCNALLSVQNEYQTFPNTIEQINIKLKALKKKVKHHDSLCTMLRLIILKISNTDIRRILFLNDCSNVFNLPVFILFCVIRYMNRSALKIEWRLVMIWRKYTKWVTGWI